MSEARFGWPWKGGGRMRRGFTLVELLIVLVIIGVLAMMLGPTFSTGTDLARIRAAGRGAMQLSRYARTMALLHQMPIDLEFSSDGVVRVIPVGAAAAMTPDPAASGSLSERDSGAHPAGAGRNAQAAPPAPPTASETTAEFGAGGGTYEMADVAITRRYDQVTFTFLGHTDTMDDGRSARQTAFARPEPPDNNAPDGVAGEDDDVQTFRIRYHSNGSCRPYRVRVAVAGDEALGLTVAVDRLGAGRIEDDGT